jgi:hypothetical protein
MQAGARVKTAPDQNVIAAPSAWFPDGPFGL